MRSIQIHLMLVFGRFFVLHQLGHDALLLLDGRQMLLHNFAQLSCDVRLNFVLVINDFVGDVFLKLGCKQINQSINQKA